MKKMQWIPKGQKDKQNETKPSAAPSPQLEPSHAQPQHKKKADKKKPKSKKSLFAAHNSDKKEASQQAVNNVLASQEELSADHQSTKVVTTALIKVGLLAKTKNNNRSEANNNGDPVSPPKVEFKRTVVIADNQPKRLTVSTPAASVGSTPGYISALQMQLFTAVYYDLLEEAKLAIRKGADVNRICGDNFTLKHSHTLLYIACYQGYSALVTLLLENKAEVNQPIDDGSTPLIIACQRNKVNVVKLLLDYRALVNIFDNDGETPIFAAAGVGAIDIVSLLIDKGVDVNSKNNNAKGATPLFIACQQGHARMVKLLLSKGADIDQTRNDGISPLQVATMHGHLAVIELLNNSKKPIVKENAGADRPKINAVTKKEEKHKSVSGAGLLKEIPKRLAFLPPLSIVTVNVINDKLNEFFKISEKAKGRVVWSASDSSSDTWELNGLLIPLAGKKYFSKKLIALGLEESTDFIFKEKSRDTFVLSLSNIKHPAFVSALEEPVRLMGSGL